MSLSKYDPETGIVNIEGREFTAPCQVRLSHSNLRIRTQAVVVDHLMAEGVFRDRNIAGRVVKAADSFILSKILEVSAIAPKQKSEVTLSLDWNAQKKEWVVSGHGPKAAWGCQKTAMQEFINRAQKAGFGDGLTVK